MQVDESTGLTLQLQDVGVDEMRSVAGQVATWVTVKATPSGPARVGTFPHRDVVKNLLVARWPEDAVPTLEGIVECPTFVADGALVATPGYDKSSRLLYVPAKGLVVPEVPAAPTPQQIKKARSLLRKSLLGDFPFEDTASQTNALALLLQPFVRPMIDGPTPLYLINAAKPGSGKGLLADVVSVVATGRAPPPRQPPPRMTPSGR